KTLKRGDSLVRQCDNMVATVWRDKNLVYLLANRSCDAKGKTTVTRQVMDTKKKFSCPPTLPIYQRTMGGVDYSNQMQAYYPPGRKQLKRWQLRLQREL